MSTTLTFTVPAMTCGHCEAAVTSEVSAVEGVTEVNVDLEAKIVTVHGEDLNQELLIAAIDEAGFEVE